MRAVAIDPGLMVGWARCDGACGEWPLAGDADPMSLFHAYRLRLADLLAEYRPAVVIVEQAFFGRIPHADVTIAACFAAHETAWLHECRRAEMTAKEVRTRWWAKHKPTDKQRIAFARMLGWPALTDHAADAALLLAAWQVRQEAVAA